MDATQHPATSASGPHHSHRSASRRSLGISLALIMGYMVAEVIGGLVSGSLALIADAGHMLTDGAAIGLALLAIWIASRPASIDQTFGFQRTEVLAALLNALSLWLIAAWIFFEAARRFGDSPEVDGALMLGVGAVGLLVNVVAAWILHRSAGESLNVEGAFRHVIADLLGSVAVVAAGVLVLSFGWDIADPIFGIVIGVLILASSFHQGVPKVLPELPPKVQLVVGQVAKVESEHSSVNIGKLGLGATQVGECHVRRVQLGEHSQQVTGLRAGNAHSSQTG